MITCMKIKSFILKYASKIMFYDANIACYHKPCGNYLLSSLSILVKSFEEEIQPSGDRVDTTRD